MKLWIPTAVTFLVAGVLELLFAALSVLGTLLGGVASVAALAGAFRGEEAFFGPVIFLFYGVWLVATAIAGPLHIAAGVSILTGRRNRTLLWVATAASVLPMLTVYCAATSIAAGIMGLLTAILTMPRPADPGAGPDTFR